MTDANQFDSPIVYVNPASELLSGYAADEILGRNCRVLRGTDHDQPGVRKIRLAVVQGRGTTVTLCDYRKDGTLFPNELSVSPVHDASGTLTHYMGFQTDVTDREEARQRLISTLERITDGLGSLDRDLNFAYVNAVAASISGKRPEDLTGQNLFTTFAEFADSAVVQAIQRARETGTPQSAVGYLEPFGKWVHATAYPAADGVSVFSQDITERYQAQEQLRISEERFSEIFRAGPMPLAITRLSDQQFIDVNEAFLHQSGYLRGEVIGRTSEEIGL